ncbi:MAG: peptide chain release factor N(5)-glutamine methyltransferase [Bacteroidetes bacterium]|nr:MAG: peptide chain release factor N(5)-glutamine methyltransferase [Bacteroidota bacterium]
MFVTMTFQEAYQQLKNSLLDIYGGREAENIASLVMGHLTGMNRLDRLMKIKEQMPEDQQNRLLKYQHELISHKPVQYVLGETWFYGLRLYVDENVLIPRPETEELVDWVVNDYSKNIASENIRILDIGTGSGCIALGLKKKLSGAQVQGIDISEGALKVAQLNAKENEIQVEFIKSDFLQEMERDKLGKFEIIISNPPYIPYSDKNSMNKNVLDFEPHLALFVNNNRPLIFYETVSNFAKSHLANGGTIYFELHESLGEHAVQLFKLNGFAHIELKKDMQGKDRMLRVRV